MKSNSDNKILEEFQINPIRLRYLLDLYALRKEDIIKLLQGNNKSSVLTLEELNLILNYEKKVKLSILKKLDNIFGKGITWYISRRDLPDRKKLSIFFRKDFSKDKLNLGSIKLIEEFERKKTEIDILCSYINYQPVKKYKFTLKDIPKKAVEVIKKEFESIQEKLKDRDILKKSTSDKDFLENLIRFIEEFNVFVFEFVDKKKKEELNANFNGFFISPNMIVIKRRQDYIKREIFTLIHEFAHYLIEEEEINTKIDDLQDIQNNVEEWCNNFVYHFLIQDYDGEMENLPRADENNNFHREILEKISNKTHLSFFVLLTRLKINNKISLLNYNKVYSEILNTINQEKQKKKDKFEMQKEVAKEISKKLFFAQAKPIESNLLKKIVKINYFEGNISESRVMETLKIKNKLFEEVIYS